MRRLDDITEPDQHTAWPQLTDDQRRYVNEVWDDTVVAALEQADRIKREADDTLLRAQDVRDAARRLPTHDEVDRALEAFRDEYRERFPAGGDEGDHDEAQWHGMHAALVALWDSEAKP